MNCPACTYKSQHFAQSQKMFAPSHDGETVTFINSASDRFFWDCLETFLRSTAYFEGRKRSQNRLTLVIMTEVIVILVIMTVVTGSKSNSSASSNSDCSNCDSSYRSNSDSSDSSTSDSSNSDIFLVKTT